MAIGAVENQSRLRNLQISKESVDEESKKLDLRVSETINEVDYADKELKEAEIEAE